MKNTLDKMQMNQKGKIKCILKDSPMLRRFLDIGLAEGTSVECVLIAYGGEMKAYRIKGATIGIRKEDAQMVEIEQVD